MKDDKEEKEEKIEEEKKHRVKGRAIRTRKRTLRSKSKSPPCPEPSKPRIDDISHDEVSDGF